MDPNAFRTLSRYNIWMNDRLYAVAADIPDAERKRDLGAFFGSLHRTLNHIMVGDRIWLSRFRGEASATVSLNATLYEDFEALRAARKELDGKISDYIDTLRPAKLAAPLNYVSGVYGPQSKPLWLLVLHMFNHQTHHRGQATTLIKQLGFDPGVTDLPAMPGASG